MNLKCLKNWILSLASASALTQMVFAQATVPVPVSSGPETIITVNHGGAPAKVESAPVVVTSEPAPAAASSDEGPWRILPDEIAGFKITGWAYGTAVYNATNSGNTRYNGPMTMNEQEGVYLNQFYVSMSRGLKECFSWGVTVDAFWGNDYNASQSRDWELRNARGVVQKWNSGQDYGFSSPQSFVEVGTTKYSLKLGHFWTPIGYMVVQGPGNFFNTQPYGFLATNPFTHWGALGTANLSDNLMVQLGVVNGWDALGRPDNSSSILGNIRYTFNEKKGYLQYSIITGQEPENISAGYGTRTLNNVVLDYNVSCNVEVVLESNVGWQSNSGAETSCFYNFHPLAFYRINDCLRAGIRYEYFHDPLGFMAGIRNGNPNNGPVAANNLGGPYNGNNQTVAAGLNWNPNGSKNLMIRPEVRYDWFSGNGQPYNAGTSTNQWLFVLGGVLQF